MREATKETPEIGMFHFDVKRKHPILFNIGFRPASRITAFFASIFFWLRPQLRVEIDGRVFYQGSDRDIQLDQQFNPGRHVLIWSINRPRWNVKTLRMHEVVVGA